MGAAAALTAVTGEVRAEPLCEPDLSPELCIPGISTSPECQMRGPAGAPGAGSQLELTAPERVVAAAGALPAPATRRLAFARVVLGAARPGFARGIDRPPKPSS